MKEFHYVQNPWTPFPNPLTVADFHLNENKTPGGMYVLDTRKIETRLITIFSQTHVFPRPAKNQQEN